MLTRPRQILDVNRTRKHMLDASNLVQTYTYRYIAQTRIWVKVARKKEMETTGSARRMERMVTDVTPRSQTAISAWPSLVPRGLAKKRTLQIASAKPLSTNPFFVGNHQSSPLPAPFPRPQILHVAVPSPRRLSDHPADFQAIRWCKWEFRRQLFRNRNSRGTRLSSEFWTSDLKSQSPNELWKSRVR